MFWLRQSRYGYLWVTLAFFVITLAGHWLFGWLAYVNEQTSLHAAIKVSDYAVEMGRDTLENWQAEFLQLMWQVGGLAFLLYVGSPQSKEGSERIEAKIDTILETVDKKDGKQTIAALDRAYPRDQSGLDEPQSLVERPQDPREVVAALQDQARRRDDAVGPLPPREFRRLLDAVERTFRRAPEHREHCLFAQRVDRVVAPFAGRDLASIHIQYLREFFAVKGDLAAP